jgi:hypothetical protein
VHEVAFMRFLLARLVRLAEQSADRPLYPVLVATVAAVDYLIPGAPTNAVLVASVLPRPARWRRLGVAFAIGDAVGAVALAGAVALVGDPVVVWIQNGEAAVLWGRIAGYVSAYGLLVLAALAITPLPARIATAVLALAGTAPLVIGLVVLAGRLVSYPAVAYLAARAPKLLFRFRPLARSFLSPPAPPSDQPPSP